jgi:glycosyltransferase involved in cell wall biosynthesis
VPFSVLIPTYHRNDLLAQCLDRLAPSVQTLAADQYEVIVSDDGKNSTAEALIKENYPWVCWVKGPQRGPAANRNFAATQAKHPWLVFTDDDCLPEPGWLKAYADAIQPGICVYEGCTTCHTPFSPLVEETPENLTGGCLWSCNFMIARSVFQEVHGFDEAFPFPFQEDTDFRERVKSAGHRFPFLTEATVDHPPRSRRFGVRMGQVRECDVLLWYKGGQTTSATVPVIKSVVSSHLARFKQMRGPSKNAWIAFHSMFGELGYVLAHVQEWDEKYKKTPASYKYKQI